MGMGADLFTQALDLLLVCIMVPESHETGASNFETTLEAVMAGFNM